MITIYGSKRCPQCTSTANYLKRKGIQYSYIDIQEDKAAEEFIRNRGLVSLPAVIVVDSGGKEVDCWTGFRMDKLMKHANP